MSDHPRDSSSDDTVNPDDLGMAADGSGDHIDVHITAPGIVPAAGEGALRRKTASGVMIMAPSRADDDEPALDFRAHAKSKSKNQHQDWDGVRVDPVVAAAHGTNGSSGRKTSAIMAVAVVAGIAGALGTAMATAGVSYFTSKPDPAVAVSHARALDESMNRIEQDLAALRSNVDRVAKASASQAGKTTDRLDRIEKAQAEPTAKLAKLTDTVEKLRVAAVTPPAPMPAAAPPAPAPVASLPAKEVTGSIASKDPAPKPEVARLPIVEGWVLLDAGNGGATIESRRGVFDVIAGDPVPGLGRVDAIRRQDGRWVVVTSKGLIVAR